MSLPGVALDEPVLDEPALGEPALDELVLDEPVFDEAVLGAAGALLAPDDSPPAAGLSEDPPFELVLDEGDEGAGDESGSVFPFLA